MDRRRTCPVLLLLLPLTATLDPTAATGDEPSPERAIEAVRAGDYASARAILGQLLFEQKMHEGKTLMAEGQPLEALLPLDAAIELEPSSGEAWFLRGQAAYDTADSNPAKNFWFYEDAFENYREALRRGYGIQAYFAASRAARRIPDPERALEYAVRGYERLKGLEPRPQLDVAPERTLAEASFDNYVARKAAQEDASELFAMTRDTLHKLLGRAGDDPWVYLQLANLYQWEGDLWSATERVRAGLDVLPENEALHNRLVELERERGGRPAVLETYTSFNQRHPSLALGLWYPAQETFLLAGDALALGADASVEFREAEELFQRCGELQPEYADACRSYGIVCRGGIGWSLRNAGDLEGARAAFMSMEELAPGGVAWEYAGIMYSGVRGLQVVADEYYKGNENDPDAVRNAAAIYDFLRQAQPEDPWHANNAGFFNRDAAVLLETQARVRLLRRARETSDPTERKALEQGAAAALALADELMERSYAAYVDAAELAPDNVRIVNDTGLIMTYYLRTDAETAERYLLRAIELAPAQLERARAAAAEEGIDEAESEQRQLDLAGLTEAYGDAHENLGILYLTLKNEPAVAKAWFEKAVAIGPQREWVASVVLPLCDRATAGEDILPALEDRVWIRRP